MLGRTKKQSLKIAKRLYPLSRKKLGGGRLTVELFNEAGDVVQRTVGPTTAQQRKEHAYGRCHAFCGFCVWDVEQYLKKNPITP